MLCTSIPGKYLLTTSSSLRKIETIRMRAPVTTFPHLLPLCFLSVPASLPALCPWCRLPPGPVDALFMLLAKASPSTCILDLISPVKSYHSSYFPLFHLIHFPFYWVISTSMHVCCYFFHLKKQNKNLSISLHLSVTALFVSFSLSRTVPYVLSLQFFSSH